MQQDQGATANLSSHFQKQTDLRTFTSTDFLIRGMYFPQLTCNKADKVKCNTQNDLMESTYYHL